MPFQPPSAPTRRTILQLLAGASATAMASIAQAQTAGSLQDVTNALAPLPQATIYVARKVITMEPNSDGTDAVVVVGDRILGSGNLADIEAGLLPSAKATLDDVVWWANATKAAKAV